MNNRLIVVISYKAIGNSSDWGIIHTNCSSQCNESCLYYNHKTLELRHSRTNFSFSFSFIKENCNKLNDIVNNIIGENIDKQISLAVHKTKYSEIKENINSKNLEIKRFRHENDPDRIWKYLEPLLLCIRDRENEYELLYDNLWNRLVPSSTQHTDYILSTFFPLHLELQLENNDEECKRVAKEILGLESDIKECMKKINELQVKYEGKFPDYINSISKSASERINFLLSYCELINKARSMESIPKSMDFDDFHKHYEDLKNNLLKITYTIREIEAS